MSFGFGSSHPDLSVPAALQGLELCPSVHSAYGVGFLWGFLALFLLASFAGSRVLVLAGLWVDFPTLRGRPRSLQWGFTSWSDSAVPRWKLWCPAVPYLCWVCCPWWTLTLPVWVNLCGHLGHRLVDRFQLILYPAFSCIAPR